MFMSKLEKGAEPNDLRQCVSRARDLSLELARPLSAEDQCAQAMDDASPTKWHLAHTTWFFETFILKPHFPSYRLFDDRFGYCFNSYYEAEGERQPRPSRGLMTRPGHEDVVAYRRHVDDGLSKLCELGLHEKRDIARLLEIGVNHEQQHQELLLMDILALFAINPLKPAYHESPVLGGGSARPINWIAVEGGIAQIGHSGEGFCFDNEEPRHRAFIQPFVIADRLVTNGEWIEFIEAGGYSDPRWWLSDGWATVQRQGWRAPLYFEKSRADDHWRRMGLDGLRDVDLAAPVCNVSYFEADAYARFAGKRLPTEFEWECASSRASGETNSLGSGALKPLRAPRAGGAQQMFGDCWEWTQSAYLPYPRYRAPAGAIGEYNGKFMVSQMVLRGGSCITPDGHARPTYRNFFYPAQRWQFAGLRLADDAS
jgi:ergothioneine biosynthesis protein EgtB